MRRRDRLRRNAEIENVRKSGRRVHHALAMLHYRPNDDQRSRFCFVAGRRVGTAVRRNRAKRLLREALRQQLPAIHPGWDCVFVARAAAADATFVDVEAAVLHLLGQAHLLNQAVLAGRSKRAASG